jgi:hypothetical protein
MENSFSHRKKKGVDVSAGPVRKRRDVMRIHDVINTPPILYEDAPSSSRQGIHDVINTPPILYEDAPSSSRQGTHVVCPLDFIFELVLQTSFSWPFPSYILKFDISSSTSLLNTNNFACFSLHHLDQQI